MIIGLIGKKQSGKTEIAKYLMEISDLKFVKLSFANKVKEVCKLIYDLSDIQLFGDQKEIIDKRYNLTPRFIMQQMGTEVARNIHSDTWIMALNSTYNMCIEFNKQRNLAIPNFIIDDCRFLNEADWIKSKHGIIVNVNRPNIEYKDLHLSETEMESIEYDWNIINNRDILWLHTITERLIIELKDCLDGRCKHSEHSII